MLITLIAFILTISILVVIHEYGHYWVAKRCGVKVIRFSIGFGKALYTWRNKLGVEFVIAAIPLGGYVKLQQDSEEGATSAEVAQAFNNKPLAARFAIVAAGPVANFLLAFVAFTLLHLIGTWEFVPYVGKITADSPAAIAALHEGDEIVALDNKPTSSWQDVYWQLLARVGDEGSLAITTQSVQTKQDYKVNLPLTKSVWASASPDSIMQALGFSLSIAKVDLLLAEVEPGSTADKAGLKKGDKLVTLDNEPISSWLELVTQTRARLGKSLALGYLRDGQLRDAVVIPEAKYDEDEGQSVGHLGVGLSKTVWDAAAVRRLHRAPPIKAMQLAAKQTFDISVMSVQMMYKMLVGKADLRNLSGPISIAKGAGESARSGAAYYFEFIALVSVSLAVINLLPIPLLDGGHLLYYAIEFFTRKRVSERVQRVGLSIGMIVLLSLMVLGLYNDLAGL